MTQQPSHTIHIGEVDPEKEDRFARFRLINWWDQKRLQNAKVLVIGAGALGNEILKNLALMGIGNIFVADLDRIENSNLSRSILYREADNGKPKAETAARAVKEIYPDANVQYFNGDIIHDLGMGVFRWADLVVAGLDNREARLAINRNCWKTNTPWIDGAIEQLNGVARVFVPPDGACYECTMGQRDWEILKARRACNLLSREEMLMGRVPTTPTSASIIAAIQCQEAVKLIHGLYVLKSKGFMLNGLTHDSYIIEYPRKEECFSHETYTNIRSLKIGVSQITIKRLLEAIRGTMGKDAVMELSRDILHTLECTACHTQETVLQSLGKVSEKQGPCPHCGTMRVPHMLHTIDGGEPFLDKTLADIGIPPYDIVVGRNGMDHVYMEFTNDAPTVLGPLFKNLPQQAPSQHATPQQAHKQTQQTQTNKPIQPSPVSPGAVNRNPS